MSKICTLVLMLIIPSPQNCASFAFTTLNYTQGEVAYVLLPAEDAAHSLWVTRLAPVALASWARPRFSVSVITNDRPRSLRRLLDSLHRSRLFGDEVK